MALDYEERRKHNELLKSHGYRWSKQDSQWILKDPQGQITTIEEALKTIALQEKNAKRITKAAKAATTTTVTTTQSPATPHVDPEGREAVQRWAQIVMRHHPLILYTQAIGNGNDAEIIDIALVDLYGRLAFHSSVQPSQLPLWSNDPQITIDNDLLRQAPTFGDLWKKLRPALTGYEIIAYDAATNLRNLRLAAARSQFVLPAIISHCLQKQYTIYTGGIQGEREARPATFAEACAAFQIAIDPHNVHNARSNAEATRLLIIAMATASQTA
jgi:DNA polymerase-3 subunit epsilon